MPSSNSTVRPFSIPTAKRARFASLGRLVLGCFALMLVNGARADELPSTGAIVLENPSVRLEFVPKIGRVMFFGFRDGENFLWVNNQEDLIYEYNLGGWRNYGGEKIWPGPQALWAFAQGRGWPPDPDLDGSGVESVKRLSERSITVTFPVSKIWGVQLSRTFELDEQQPLVHLRNTLTRRHGMPVPLQIWSVAQLPHPDSTWLESLTPVPTGGPYLNLNRAADKPPFTPPPLPEGSVTVHGQWTTVSAIPEQRMKVGTLGGAIAAVTPAGIFLQKVAFDKTGAYPEASSVQVLLNNRYVEIETLSPLVLLDVDESYSFDITWALLPPTGAATPDEIETVLNTAVERLGVEAK
ncbi:MAG: DUF4380 domain-containing protein [Verrucomicrobiota bacterium JB024]|nr:DUF4380 domain-containing protein [Verrucomicrobiota bacterium JB024]